MKPLDENGLAIVIVLGAIVFVAGWIRSSLGVEINRWPNQPDTNRWYEFVRLAALVVLVAIAVTIAKLATDECLARLASS